MSEEGILRADGARPYNNYLWALPDDWFSAPERHISSRFNFYVVALADGRWATDGATYSIESNSSGGGRPCVYPSRDAALRTAAGRTIRLARAARRWPDPYRLSESQAQDVIDWVRSVVEQESGVERPRTALHPIPAVECRPGIHQLDLFRTEASA